MSTDADELTALEARASVRPWVREIFVEELARTFSQVFVVRDASRALVAFSVSWLVDTELHILNIATEPSMRRRGFATQLLAHCVRFATERGCVRVLLEVRRSNRAAIALYTKHGFRPIGIRAGYYAKEHEDAIVMARDIKAE